MSEHGNRGRSWSFSDDQLLRYFYLDPEVDLHALAEYMGRTDTSLRSQAQRLGLVPKGERSLRFSRPIPPKPLGLDPLSLVRATDEELDNALDAILRERKRRHS